MRTTKLFGPPGTGKTFALLEIMERELEAGVPPDRIAYMTFTVQARREAVHRANQKFGYEPDQLPFFRTLHSIAYRQLGANQASLITRTVTLDEFAEEIGVEFTDQDATQIGTWSGRTLGDKLLAFDHFFRHRLADDPVKLAREWPNLPRVLEGHERQMFSWFSQEYARWKRREGLVDFTDLLMGVLEPLPVDVAIVDEAQDLSTLQWRVLHQFATNASRVYVAGDDDQAIFTWAGADPSRLLALEAETKVLGQSYRVPVKVGRLAEGIVRGIAVRQPKEWRPRDTLGSVRTVVEPSGLDLAEGSWLILYRNHYLGDRMERMVRQQGVSYARSDRPAPGTEWGRSIWLWESARQGMPLSGSEVRHVLKATSLAARDLELDRIYTMTEIASWGLPNASWTEVLDRVDEVEYLSRLIEREGLATLVNPPRVRLSTIHGSKGAQADNVILMRGASRNVLETMERHPDDERRVWYVGVTRARENLFLAGHHRNPILDEALRWMDSAE